MTAKILKIKITDSFIAPHKGLIFTLNLKENNFDIINNKYEILNSVIEVNNKTYIIKEFEKIRTAASIEWDEKRPIGIAVKEL